MKPMKKPHKILVKNMVCQRCILTLGNILEKLDIPARNVAMGEVELDRALTPHEATRLESELNKVGFEIIATRMNKLVEDIKMAVIDYVAANKKLKLSTFITDRIPNDYSYLSDLFSSIEGTTIEQFFILQRIEKVKELLVYDQLSLTQVADETGFSSVHHLSAQFKKVTGLTPTHFKPIAGEKRRALDQLS